MVRRKSSVEEAGVTDGRTASTEQSGVDAPAAPVLGVATRALGWSLLNTLVSKFGTLAIGIALARVLGPEQFGTFAVSLVALLAILSFNELGVSLAIVRWPDDPKKIAPTVTTISTLSSLILTSIGLVAAPWFASAMGEPQATGVVQLMMASVLINGLVATPAALMQREFKQSRRMVIDQVNMWAGALISIGLAVAGMGAMSLAIGRVAGSVLAAILFLWWSPLPLRFGWSGEYLGRLLRFGLPLAGASMVVFISGYADQLVVGHTLGPTQLGFYVLAVNLASWPLSMFSAPLRAVAPAIFARLQNDPELRRNTFRTTARLLGAASFPCCLVLAGAALPVISFVYGRQWTESAGPLAWLAGLAVLRIVFELTYDYLVVLGKSGALFRAQVVNLLVMIPAVILGMHVAGISGIAAAQTLVALCVMLPLYLWELGMVGLPARGLIGRLLPPLLVAALAGVAANLIGRSGLSDWWASVACGAVLLVATAWLLWRERASVAEFRRMSGADR